MPNWRDDVCVIVASGPSLTLDQVELVETSRARTIAVNSSYARFEHAPDVVYACDLLWWRAYADAVCKRFPDAARWTQERAAAEQFQLKYVRHESRDGLGKKALRTGGNSGHGALNLAYLLGCRRILLVGFDMRLGPNGEKHWHPDHPKPLVQGQQFQEWRHKFRVIAKDLEAEKVTVINCTPGSALEYFPKSDLAMELA